MLRGQHFKVPVQTPPVKERLIVLGVESTSHTFGVGVVEFHDHTVRVLANVLSQYKPEKGGIHPSEAAQHHVNTAHTVVKKALAEAEININSVNVVAVAVGPGLGPCLRVGATLARFISAYWNKPLVAVNHAVAHIEIGKLMSGMVDPLVVYISGGNTLVAVQRNKKYRILGETLDIPLGNLLDTFAREVGIAPPYVISGKHAIDVCAEWSSEFIPLPYTVKGSDLSFSGLLTAALRMARESGGNKAHLGKICNSLRETAFNMLIEVAERSLMLTDKREILLVGGVASNTTLREKFEILAKFYGCRYYGTPPEIAGDNGLMIAYTGLLQYLYGKVTKPEDLVIRQRLRLDEETYPWLP
ncbi:MAG: N(6)-L-threonylcarbamoyladenine synthase Kae1 [Desulfurococcaceae archaeon]|jgi:N6-L-threonylcarbamoyladenine synthase|nr:N(6)-L-threonylcarbamoyladenine synthase Kae1 [Desulfurococcaceae archaeon]